MLATLIKEGKAKQLFTTEDENVIRVHYMNQATALNGKRKEQIADKGEVNNQIDSLIYNYLQSKGIETHFIKQIDDSDQLVKKMTMIPLEVVIRNYASGSFQRKFDTEYLLPFKTPVQEFFYKSDRLDDPFMNDSQILALSIADESQLKTIREQALKVNDALTELFANAGITLVDFKLEFGFDPDGKLILGDEISPDSCRLVDAKTHESLDKDVFRKHTGDVMDGYRTVLSRLQATR
ncbi:phosphoribosylaminoimidazolesuccinocarboxamide synthase [Secundilactobacillus collinoides]|uniref:Phosphoribosylaminoimidazole-succinocarboxamide synthase n=1 Tax=Secundilactobacillus collinoides TaxID=33960 RepID=A0A161VH67_SECCO|nr:phosphoribosylaminoimidazolesuccinocarboxamide synthase [Secundilactobacillus collinoides]KZL39206.1 phosphoribosylaminoimidazole-succinocarboxamide synthase [Secundilactobacillus collinoides]